MVVKRKERTIPIVLTIALAIFAALFGSPSSKIRGLVVQAFNFLLISKIQETSTVQDFYGPQVDDFVTPIKIKKRYPGLGDAQMFVSKTTMNSEKTALTRLAIEKGGLYFKRIFSLSFTFSEPWFGTGTPWTERWERFVPLPERPKDFQENADAIAGLLTRGPFSIYSAIDEERGGDVVLDLSALDNLQPRKPFVPAGGVARAHYDEDRGVFTTKSITFQGTEYTPGTAGYDLTQKRFMAGLVSYTTLIDHLTYCHLLSAQVNVLAVFEALSAQHPLRIMMQPFITETTKVNNKLIDGLIKWERSNVPSYTGYSLDTVNQLMINATKAFDVRILDPEQRYALRGVPMNDPRFPTIQSTVDLFKIYRKFAESWCNEFLKDGVDKETQAYVMKLHERTSNGIFPLIGIHSIEQLEVSHVAHIIATLAFTGSVWHHIVNDLTGPYFFTFDMMPPAVDKNGNPTLGVVLDKRNSIIAAAVHRFYLLPREGQTTKSIIDILPEESMKKVWKAFEDDLLAYKKKMDAEEENVRDFCVDPFSLTSSIHG